MGTSFRGKAFCNGTRAAERRRPRHLVDLSHPKGVARPLVGRQREDHRVVVKRRAWRGAHVDWRLGVSFGTSRRLYCGGSVAARRVAPTKPRAEVQGWDPAKEGASLRYQRPKAATVGRHLLLEDFRKLGGGASERKERGGERVCCGRAGAGLWCERAGGFRSMARMDVHNCAAQACRERVRMDASAPRASAPRGPHLVERDLSGAVLVRLSDERLDLRRRHLELHQRNDLHQL